MPSDKPKIVIYTDLELIQKLDILANQENRSRANIAETILKNFIHDYEICNGNITIGDINISGNNSNINIGNIGNK